MINILKLQKIILFITAFIAYLSSTTLLDPISSIIFLILFLISLYFEKHNIDFPKTIIYLLAVLSIGLSSLLLDNILVQTFLILILVKLLKKKENIKEYNETFFVSISLFLIASFFIQESIFMFYFTILIFLSSFYLVLYSLTSTNQSIVLEKKEFINLSLMTLFLIATAIILATIIYNIIPRLDKDRLFKKSKLGFSKVVNLGDVYEIQKRNLASFRVKMPKIDQNRLYFRGYTTQYFNGKRWINIYKAKTKNSKLVGSKTIKQKFFIKPFSPVYIFGLDIPKDSNYKNLVFDSSYCMLSSRLIDYSLDYNVTSLVDATIEEELLNKEDFLQIPKKLSKTTKEEILKISNYDKNIFLAIKRYFNKYYKYSLNRLPVSDKPLKEFIIQKRGNCEYFATLAALVFRSNGYPARLVVGFRGGSYNSIEGFYTVYQKNAHAWVEVYINNQWKRFDPTPTIKKDSLLPKKIINYYEYLTFYTHKVIIFLVKVKKAILDRFVEEIDFGTYQAKNKAIFDFIKELVFYIFFSLIILYLIDCKYSPFIVIRRSNLFKRFFSKEEKIINEVLKILNQHGYKKEKHQTIKEVIYTIEDKKLKQLLLDFIKEFEKQYYKDYIDINYLNKMLKNIKKQVI